MGTSGASNLLASRATNPLSPTGRLQEFRATTAPEGGPSCRNLSGPIRAHRPGIGDQRAGSPSGDPNPRRRHGVERGANGFGRGHRPVLNGTTQNALFEQLERSALKPLPADTYAEATWTQGLSDWIGSHTRTFAFIDGVPAMVVSDNAFEPT